MADKRFREIKGILSDLDDTLYNFSGIQEQALAETALLAASCLDVYKRQVRRRRYTAGCCIVKGHWNFWEQMGCPVHWSWNSAIGIVLSEI